MVKWVTRVNGSETQRLLGAYAILPGTVAYGNYRFPSVPQYTDATRALMEKGEGDLPSAVAAALTDWHQRGQNGCLFARLAASDSNIPHWNRLVVDPGREPEEMSELEAEIQKSIEDPAAHLLSIAWPGLREPDEIVRLIGGLLELSRFWLECDMRVGNLRSVQIRYPVSKGLQAWVMAFGPFGFLPATRRAPFFELVLRIKRKPETAFHRLNQDASVAHLADFPLEMSEQRWEHRWRSTMNRTRVILGHEPDAASAAKSTILLPLSDPGLREERST
ncbi:hypothetical protein [Streptomyces sp. NPDC002054]|uniref:hypothetical protein n=1 Tax=Streptomyces sp. NPDC002054 TaxID=3154663 RepID=UPI003321852D